MRRQIAALNAEPFSEAKELVGEYSTWLGECGKVRIQIWREIADGSFGFRQSHFLHTPTQASPYHSSRTDQHPTAEAALNECLSGFKVFYSAAIREGHEPTSDWLVPNKNF